MDPSYPIVIGVGFLSQILIRAAARRRRTAMGKRRDDATLKFVLKGEFDPRSRIEFFRDAGSPELMEYYVNGFSGLVFHASTRGQGMSVLDEIESLSSTLFDKQVKEKQYKNRHRVQSFPAAAAAHFIPILHPTELDRAERLILDAMSIDQREIQEIVPQNLISSLTVSDFAWQRFWVSDQVIEALRAHIAKSATYPFLCVGANLALQFLVYYREALRERDSDAEGNRDRQLGVVEKAIEDVRSKRDPYAWFELQWLQGLEKTVEKLSRHRKQSIRDLLPPQSTELVMGWRNPFRDEWVSLLPYAMLNNAFLVHLNRQTVAGKYDPELLPRQYTVEDAGVALEKGEEWFEYNRFPSVVFEKAIKSAEGEFEKTVCELARKTAGQSYPSCEPDPDISLVPFRAHLNPFDPRGIGAWTSRVDRLMGFLEKLDVVRLIKLGMDNWEPFADRTPDQIEKAVRPTETELQKRIEKSGIEEAVDSLRGRDFDRFRDNVTKDESDG